MDSRDPRLTLIHNSGLRGTWYGTDEMDPHGPRPVTPEELWETITYNPELIFEPGSSD
jgi:hypothetical protein